MGAADQMPLLAGDVLVRCDRFGVEQARYRVGQLTSTGSLMIYKQGGTFFSRRWRTVGDLPKGWHRLTHGPPSGPTRRYLIKSRMIYRGKGLELRTRGEATASSPEGALRAYLAARPSLKQTSAIEQTRPGVAMVTARLKSKKTTTLIAIPE